MPPAAHDELVSAAFRKRGYTADEAQAAARFSNMASLHGIRTHNAIKALHLDEHLGSGAGGCRPGATIEKLPSRFKAVERWNANRKLGMAVAFEAMNQCMKLADEFGVGTVAVDNAFHYLWGGGYVIDAADQGYIAYTCCTAALAEVVPFGGKFPTLGTNPHSWGFPTRSAIGFPICVDWATSTVAMGRVQQFVREGKSLPPGSAVDAEGRETTDPNRRRRALAVWAAQGIWPGLDRRIDRRLYRRITSHAAQPLEIRTGGRKAHAEFFLSMHSSRGDRLRRFRAKSGRRIRTSKP